MLRRPDVIWGLFVAVFIVYALNYAYFFVDDEAIPFIYAQHVIDGRGLVYNPNDGRVEGYSDFLSIWIDVVILGSAAVAGVGKLWALAAGKLVGFVFAVALLFVAFNILKQQAGGDRVPLVAGMTFLALAGPLAVWSLTALETTLFALITAILISGLVGADHSDPANDRLILFSVVAMLLCRIDGFVWSGALVAPFLISVGRTRRRELAARVVAPAVVVFVAYHAWRVWYFGELLPMPVYTKVLYKLRWHSVLVANEPAQPYVLAFLRAYRGIPLVAIGLGFAGTYRRSPVARSLATGIALVIMYLWIVGDWMFGFRFFVPLLVPIALVASAGFGDLRRGYPRAALAAAVVWIVAVGAVAYDFCRVYERVENRESWLVHPSFDPTRFFAPYYQNYLTTRAYVNPGDTIAYNQAGFVPFMLDARNIDNLGICTKFYAKLPTTDVIFTEVGRYTPLTTQPALPAGETYMLSHAPRLLLAPARDLRSANRGAIPKAVLAGAYRLRFSNSSVAGYVPVVPLEPIRDPRRYLENLVHISSLRRASIDGRVLAISEYRRALRYLYGRPARIEFKDRYTAEFTFSAAAEDVYELYVGGAHGPEAASISVALLDRGVAVYRNTVDVPARGRPEFYVKFDHAVRATSLSMTILPDAPGTHTFYLEDVRVQGQTPALQQFLKAFL
jgi:hypothetical protein